MLGLSIKTESAHVDLYINTCRHRRSLFSSYNTQEGELLRAGGPKQNGIRYSVTDMGADWSAFAVQADPKPWPSHMVTIPSLPG